MLQRRPDRRVMAILDRARRAAPFAVVFAAGIWLWTVADSFAISTRLGRLGPEVWPKIILLLLLLAALWGTIEAFIRAAPDGGASIMIKQATRSAGHEEDAEKALQGDTDAPVDRRPIFAVAGIAAM